MSRAIGRRELIGAAGAAAVVSAIGSEASAQESNGKRKIVAVSCSLRKGKTTAAGLTLCLEAAKEQDPELKEKLWDEYWKYKGVNRKRE